MRDFKSQFYRTLNLDEESRKILKWYRKAVKELKNEAEGKKPAKEKKEEQK